MKHKKYLYILFTILVTAFLIQKALNFGDFKVFLEAGKLIANGENPYNYWIYVSEESHCLYFYSPLWAIILIPFSYLPNFIPNIIWLTANIYFLSRIWRLLKNYIQQEKITTKQLNIILLLTSLMSFRFILYNFDMIQMTLFLLWGSLESIKMMDDKKRIFGGMLLALLINIKILPIVIIPYLLYRKKFKGVVSTLFFSMLFLLLPAIFVGWSKNMFLLTEWWSVINPLNSEHLIETESGFHSLTALIPNLLIENQEELSHTRNILNLSKEKAILVLNTTRAILVILTIFFLKWPPFKAVKSKLFKLREIAFITLLIPLIFPHQQKYAFVLIIPSLFYLNHFMVTNSHLRKDSKKRKKWYLLVLLMSLAFVLMTISTDGIIGRKLNLLTQHYKTITWGTLLLIVSLIVASPKKIMNKKNNLHSFK